MHLHALRSWRRVGALCFTATIVAGCLDEEDLDPADDDPAASALVGASIEATSGTIALIEGSGASVGVRLTAPPAAPIAVSIATADPSAVTATPTTLWFTPFNWNVFQPLHLAAVEDPDAAAESVAITLAGPGLAPLVVTTNVSDNDVLALATSTSNLVVNEGGTASFAVRLTAMPAADVAVSISTSDPSAATPAPALVVIHAASWNVWQTVHVSGLPDPDAVHETVQLTLVGPGLPPRMVAVQVHDDDVMAIVTTTAAVSVGEGGSISFGVRLSAMPIANVLVSVVSADPSVAWAPTTSLVFTPGNWNVFQGMTVVGVADPDLLTESTTITLSSPGMPNRLVTATVVDLGP